MSGEEKLPEKQWKRVNMSGSLKERMSEEMSRLNDKGDEPIPLRGVQKYLLNPR